MVISGSSPAAKIRKRGQRFVEAHIVIFTFGGIDPVPGFSQVMQIMQNFLSGFAEVAVEVNGLDVNAP